VHHTAVVEVSILRAAAIALAVAALAAVEVIALVAVVADTQVEATDN
jgi:hypothetical protein